MAVLTTEPYMVTLPCHPGRQHPRLLPLPGVQHIHRCYSSRHLLCFQGDICDSSTVGVLDLVRTSPVVVVAGADTAMQDPHSPLASWNDRLPVH